MSLYTLILITLLFAVAGFLGAYTFMGMGILMSGLVAAGVAAVGTLITIGITTWFRKPKAEVQA